MSPEVLELKLQANHEYEMEKYSNAIDIYNKALGNCDQKCFSLNTTNITLFDFYSSNLFTSNFIK